MGVWIVSIILLAALVLLITEAISVDLTAIGIMVALMVTGILDPQQAVAGFANPAVITVAAMFLISQGMIRTGAVGFIAGKVIDISRGRPRLALGTIMLAVGTASAFINNTPIVVLFIPIILNLACEYDLSPSKFFIPMSYASILAGTCTLIGTSTNIIISDLSSLYGYGELGMFELSSLGIPVALAGILLIYLASPRLMPEHAAPVCELGERQDKRYLAELLVPAGSPMIGRMPDAYMAETYHSLDIIEMIREGRILHPQSGENRLAAADLLLVRASATDLMALLRSQSVELPHSEKGISFGTDEKDPRIVELIVPPQSSLLGTRLLSTSLQGDPDIHIIAIKSRQLHYNEQKIQNVRLRVGDIILVWCPSEKLHRIRAGGDFIIVEDVHHEIIDKSKARQALLVFVGIVAAAAAGLASIMVCAATGVFVMTLLRVLRLRDAYRALQPNVLLLIVGTIALGTAMEKTGASKVYAEAFMSLFQGWGPRAVLFGFLVLTSISTQILSNNATAVLILPIAISTALALGVNPKPFIVGVCFGASACFATPIGYQTNLLVYSPGGYRFADYLKLGIPLNLLVIVLTGLGIPLIWPF